MAPHSSTLAWKIPWTEEPGRLQSMGVAEGQTLLSNFTFIFHLHVLEKEMETHSSVLAWRIPGMWEPSGLPSMGSHRVWHDWSDAAAAAAALGPLNCRVGRGVRQYQQTLGDLVFSDSAYVMGCTCQGLPWWRSGKEPPANAEDMGDAGLIPGLGRSLEEGEATHWSILTWKIPWAENPGGLRSMGLQRVRIRLKQLSTDAPTRAQAALTDAHGLLGTHRCCLDQCIHYYLVPSWCLLFWYHFKI